MMPAFILLFSGLTSSQTVFINEFMASNVTAVPDIVGFESYPDWIELYNPGTRKIDLSGYFLTDDLDQPKKWAIPENIKILPQQYLVFWADGHDTQTTSQSKNDGGQLSTLHLNFKLSRGGEAVALVNSDGVVVDSVVYGLQVADVSYGRIGDGGDAWGFFGESTPGLANNTAAALTQEVVAEVTSTLHSGFYNGARQLTLATATASAVIRYTLDGSLPTSQSALYSVPVPIVSNCTVRARAFKSGWLPGPLFTRSFFIGEAQHLPVLSLSAFPETLFGETYGIYAQMIKSREVPVHIDYFTQDGAHVLAADGGFRLTGQASYQYPQKPFTLYAKSRFGFESFDYPFFKNRDYRSFNALYLRNSGCPDNYHTHFRDALQHSIVINQMDLDCQAYQPVTTYINGTYWGIYNLRDKINPEFLAALHHVDPNNLDLLEIEFDEEPVVIEGDVSAWKTLLSFVENNDLSNVDNYAHVVDQIDLDEYLNYMITELYCDNINWLNTNVKWWRERSPQGKWRWILLDLDWGFGQPYAGWTSHYSHNALEMATSAPGTDLVDSPWATVFFRKLLENESFRQVFIQRFAARLNTTFTRDRVVHLLDSLRHDITVEMGRHIERWNNAPSVNTIMGEPPILNRDMWNREVTVMREFAQMRPGYMFYHIEEFFHLEGRTQLTLHNTSVDRGYIEANGVPMPLDEALTFYKGVPINLKALPRPGFSFVRWEGAMLSTEPEIELVIHENTVLEAVFEPNNASVLPPSITGTMTLTQKNSPYLLSENVTVEAGAVLTVEPGVELLASQDASLIILGRLHMNGQHDTPVVIKADAQSGAAAWGALCFEGAAASTLNHVTLQGATHGPDADRFKGAVSAFESEISLNHVTILDAPFPIFAQYGSVTIKNATLHSEKICDLINIKYAETAVVEHCDLRGNIAFDTDAIDYDGIQSGVIRGNRIYDFYGYNSDGIDLGEGAIDILVENNLIYNIVDKGVSIGQKSTAILRNNIIVNCAQGVGIKDSGSHAYIDGCTFYGNQIGVASFEKNYGVGGGSGQVVNSIIAHSTIDAVWVDALSTLEISYSLSDTEKLKGTNNLRADVGFQNNFYLSAQSPAVDAGDPGAPVDDDGSRVDLGAHAIFVSPPMQVLINEIHYHPKSGPDGAFIELFNAGTDAVSLDEFSIGGDVQLIFPSGIELAAGGFIIVAANAANAAFSDCPVFSWTGGTLSADAGLIYLLDGAGREVDRVHYRSDQGWPTRANGDGPSLELHHPSEENLYTGSWRASAINGGSPGRSNAMASCEGVFINEIMAINNHSLADEHGEYNDWIELYNSTEQPLDLGGLYLSDNPENLCKYRIPTNSANTTTIAAGGYLILWADEQSDQGPLHTNFKLTGMGERLTLVNISVEGDTAIIDSVSYGIQSTDASYGRSQDGVAPWKIFYFPTPGLSNFREGLFGKGVLLVNGVAPIYDYEIYSAWEAQAFWGNHIVSFWDLFDAPPQMGYPDALPEPIGHGEIMLETLMEYSSIVWIGNRYDGDFELWKRREILEYLQAGGNVLLFTRRGVDFFDEALLDYLGVRWSEIAINVEIGNSLSKYPGITSMIPMPNNTMVDAITTLPEREETHILFHETQNFTTAVGLGAWRKPIHGGAYKSDGGQFVYIAGRPYRFEHAAMRSNMQYILSHFFGETHVGVKEGVSEVSVITDFSLGQNYPNPFNPSTTLVFALPEASTVSLSIYNVQGQQVRSLLSEAVMGSGYHDAVWDATDERGRPVSAGIYFYRLKAGGYTETRKMLLLK